MTSMRDTPDDHQVRIPRYYDSLDFKVLWQDFRPAPEYFSTTYLMSRDELHALKNVRFLSQINRAWEIPFYQRHWAKHGLTKGDIRSLDDLRHIPPFSVYDLRESLGENPPWADFIGIDPLIDDPIPLVLQTSGGTTGLPRPMIFAPQDREVMNIITGRRLFMQGVRPFDLIQVALSVGLSNGGFLIREGIWKYTGAVPVMTGSGAQTSTRRQLEILRTWKSKHLVGFPAYLRHMGIVARDDLNIDPSELSVRGLIVHLGVDKREHLEDLWGADVYDTYGTNEFGSIASECRYKSGMHLFEDAFVMEINDPDTLQSKGPGEKGVVYLTSLFKYAAPMIRYNTNDVSATVPGECPCGSSHMRIDRIFGRNDHMIKLRGVNVFPEAVGAVVGESQVSNGEYVCIAETDNDGREDMTVFVEVTDTDGAPAYERLLADRLKETIGVKLTVKTVKPGDLDRLTGLSSKSKLVRFIDKRNGSGGDTIA